MMNKEMPHAERMMIKPITPELKSFLALVISSSLPAAVIHLKPAKMTRATARMLKIIKILLINLAAISIGDLSDKPILSWIIPSPKSGSADAKKTGTSAEINKKLKMRMLNKNLKNIFFINHRLSSI